MTQECKDEKILGSHLTPVAQMFMEYFLTLILIIKEKD